MGKKQKRSKRRQQRRRKEQKRRQDRRAVATFDIGDSVRVKAGVRCPDYDSLSIAGWQGRTFEIQEDERTVGICWDSVTLDELPEYFIKDCEAEGLSWAEMYLDVDDIEPAPPRDDEQEVDRVQGKLHRKYRWIDGDEEGERIFAVIAGVGEDDELDAWLEHLSRSLVFPFDAKVEYQGRSTLMQGERVRVLGLSEADEIHGVLVDVVRGEESLIFPLCDLTVMDTKSPNYLPSLIAGSWCDLAAWWWPISSSSSSWPPASWC